MPIGSGWFWLGVGLVGGGAGALLGVVLGLIDPLRYRHPRRHRSRRKCWCGNGSACKVARP